MFNAVSKQHVVLHSSARDNYLANTVQIAPRNVGKACCDKA